jgi:choline dehydrogenase-like flavoprotein
LVFTIIRPYLWPPSSPSTSHFPFPPSQISLTKKNDTEPKDGYQYATILATLVAPRSRGNITLISPDTNDLPIIKPAYLASPVDQAVAIAAYKRVRSAFASTFMQQTVIGPEYYPGPQVQTDAQILETIKGSLQTVWHASCTCKMGVEGDGMAVVDSKAKVYGVGGVRVVDASAFPFLPPGHPQSTVCECFFLSFFALLW